MNPLLPIIEELMDAPDHAARARWLLACPLTVLITYQGTIVNRLRHARFPLGVAYVEAEIVRHRRVRRDGLVMDDNLLRRELMAIASGAGWGPAAGA